MFSFSGAKVRRFSYTRQISQKKITKNFLFMDINQNRQVPKGLFGVFQAILFRIKKMFHVQCTIFNVFCIFAPETLIMNKKPV